MLVCFCVTWFKTETSNVWPTACNLHSRKTFGGGGGNVSKTGLSESLNSSSIRLCWIGGRGLGKQSSILGIKVFNLRTREKRGLP